MDIKILGERIRQERNKLRISQQILSENVNLSTNFIGQIERGQRICSLETIIAISKALGVNIDYLLRDYVKVEPDELLTEIEQYANKLSPEGKLYILNMIKLFTDHEENKNK